MGIRTECTSHTERWVVFALQNASYRRWARQLEGRERLRIWRFQSIEHPRWSLRWGWQTFFCLPHSLPLFFCCCCCCCRMWGCCWCCWNINRNQWPTRQEIGLRVKIASWASEGGRTLLCRLHTLFIPSQKMSLWLCTPLFCGYVNASIRI